MTCHNCRIECKRFGKDRNGIQRYRCRQCSKTFLEPHEPKPKLLGNMYIPVERIVQVLGWLVDGASISAIERRLEIHHTTILTILTLAGKKCSRLLHERIKNIPVKDVQCDEIWGFVQKKEKHRWLFESRNMKIGDAYCFVAIERDTKLVLGL